MLPLEAEMEALRAAVRAERPMTAAYEEAQERLLALLRERRKRVYGEAKESWDASRAAEGG